MRIFRSAMGQQVSRRSFATCAAATHCSSMEFCRHARRLVVAAAVEHDDGNPPVAAKRDHPTVAGGKVFGRQSHLAEAVGFVRINAGYVEDDVRFEPLDCRRGRSLERLDVRVVASPAVQRDVQIARHLGRRVVAADVQRVRERQRIVGEDRVRAVALVGVEVEDERVQPRLVVRNARIATATSLKTQKPWPLSAKAWCVPPARLQAMPSTQGKSGCGEGGRDSDVAATRSTLATAAGPASWR